MNKILLIIFLLTIILRFLYFPKNIYFGYDQARDAFAALEIAHGKLKLIGPTTSFEGLNHGVFYYYLLAPFYLIGGGSPEFTAAVLRILNAVGVIVIFLIGSVLFNRFVGILSALLYAVSFEQTQFAIYMGNPAPASVTVPLIYLGLALAIFKKNYWGLILAAFFLGLSIQLQFALLYLVIPFFVILLFNFKTLIKLPFKWWGLTFISFILSISTFLISELKYNFRITHAIFSLSNFNPNKTIFTILNSYFYTISRMVTFNLIDNFPLKNVILVLLFIIFIWTIYKYKNIRKQLLFLSVWFFALLVPFIIHGGTANLQKDVPLYYPNVGVSVSVLIFISLAIYGLRKWPVIPTVLLILIVFANLSMITSLNSKGTISEIDVQQGMLLSDEKQVLDFIYQDAGGNIFAVKGITLPFYINTTWSYLFQWYGKSKFGYLPVWNGKNAVGYPGNLEVQEAQEKLPPLRYLVIEPIRGIHQYTIDDYLKEESYFTKVQQEHTIGMFTIQKRVKF